jgi:hypothetical protein
MFLLSSYAFRVSNKKDKGMKKKPSRLRAGFSASSGFGVLRRERCDSFSHADEKMMERWYPHHR